MVKISTVFGGLALAAGAYAQAKCNPAESNQVRNAFTNVQATCNWYLSYARGASLLPSLDKPKFQKACECITGRKASTTPQPDIPNPGRPATCANNRGLITKYTKAPLAFCDMYLNARWRPDSPFPGTGVREVMNACRCWIPEPEPTTTAKRTTTAVKTTTAAKTTTKVVTTPATTAKTTTKVVTTPATTPKTTTKAVTTTPSITTKISTTVSVDPVTTSSATTTTTTSLDVSGAYQTPAATAKLARRYHTRHAML